jgi:riboflavin kinase / FMN adenylyltransferase
MEILNEAKALQADKRKVCVGIGVFDGVHLGHQQVLRQTLEDARQCEGRPVAITFDRHPNTVVAPDHAPAMIYSLDKKLATIASLGFEHILVYRFTPEFSQIPGDRFIHQLVDEFRTLHSISVGKEFTFGSKRSGNVELLRSLGVTANYEVHGLAAVALDGEPVSSTRIRSAIQQGELGAASQMLGRTYALSGAVVKGAQVGRQLGFPTANLDVSGLITPPHGVYAAHVKTSTTTYRAALNIGLRPTLAESEPTLHVEAHLLDFDGDLYGETLEITFAAKIRAEEKFPDLDTLKGQIAEDVQSARKIFE